MVMQERQMAREAKDQALMRLRIAMGAMPRNFAYSRKMVGEAIQLLEGDVSPDDVTRYHEAKR
jgi:hypothetical protein